jgi:hypothetical protein
MEAHQLSYITENIDSFQFSDFLKEFDFRDKTYAEIRFKALIDYILQYKSTNNSQKIIDFATKVKSEKFQVNVARIQQAERFLPLLIMLFC